ncbi:MAG: adenosylcobinamide-GDP ribazoletransferase [Oscillospiraceae bacterium]|nr:adenosylcobinamide-GDP ribazoletransferase [Oscillospiraceae bacterium]
MNILRPIAMAFSMFSAIPMPYVEWKEDNLRYMLCALPLVGALIGATMCLWLAICNLLGFGTLMFAVGMTLVPVLLSGGIHLDGFCDTVDALASHATPERKREIMKDSSAGAFAVIYAGVYLIALLGFESEIERNITSVIGVGIIYMFSRSLGGLASMIFRGSKGTGLFAQFRSASNKKAALIGAVWCAVCVVTSLIISPLKGIVVSLIGFVTLVSVRAMAGKEFEGMSGDVAGYLISLSELLMVAGYVVIGKVVA